MDRITRGRAGHPRSSGVRAGAFRPWLVPGLAAVLLGWVVSGVAGCGALVTTAPDAGDVFDGPLEGLSQVELAAFAEGDAQFGQAFAPAHGLGPIFNNVSCASCHSGDGRGFPQNVLVRFGTEGGPGAEFGGPQLQTRAIPGAEVETLPPGFATSHRLPPPVFGMGLIEAIPDSAILAGSDPDDTDGDGISGRPNLPPPVPLAAHAMGAGAASTLGRFGRKAQVASLVMQVATAYHQDIGITTEFLPVENLNPLASSATEAADRVADPELATTTVRSVVAYLRMLAPPAPGSLTPSRARGQEVFARIQCAGCHVPSLRTGESTIAALRSRPVDLYSDLLLHDMGEGLADHRPDGAADGREWRTAPLWGLRIMREFLKGQAFLLHDGRARSVEEAILLHGGEAVAARDSFQTLPASDRAALLDFVESR